MFSHVIVGSNDIEKSKIFYDAIMNVLGYSSGVLDSKGRYMYVSADGTFGVTKPINGEPATHGNGMTIGFKVSNSELVDRWHAEGVAHGGTSCENPPGIRESASGKKYLAYLRDPAGNKLCAAHIMPE